MENEPYLLIEFRDVRSGERQQYQLGERDFKIMGRAIELFYIMVGSVAVMSEDGRKFWSENVKDNVSLVIQAEFGITGTTAVGYIEAARAAYVTPSSILILVDNR